MKGTISICLCAALLFGCSSVRLGGKAHKSRSPGPYFYRDLSFNGKQLLIGGALWDAESGKELRHGEVQPRGVPQRFVTAARFGPDGRRVLMATARNLGAGLNLGDRVELQDLVTGEVIIRFPSQAAYVWDAQFSPDGRRAVTVDMSSIIQIWDARSGQRLVELKFPGADSLSFSPDGRRVVVLSYDKVAVLDSTTAEQICQIKAPRATARPDFFVSTQFSPDGKLVLTEQCDGVTRIWDAVTGQQTQMFSAVSATDRFWPYALFTPDGRRVISGSDDGIAILWNVEAGNEIRRFQIPGPARGPVDQMIINCDGKRLIATCKSIAKEPPAGALWDVESGRLIKQFDDLEHERIVGFSPVGHTFITVENGKPYALYDGVTGNLIRRYHEN